MSSPYELYPQDQPCWYGQQPGDGQPGGNGPPPYQQGPYGPYPQVGWEPGQRTYLLAPSDLQIALPALSP